MSISAVSSTLENQLSALQNLSSTSSSDSTSGTADGTLMFQNIYNNLISNVNSTDATFQADTIKAAEGELDNPQQLVIDSEKADVSLQLALSVRNKALEAYNSIISMQV